MLSHSHFTIAKQLGKQSYLIETILPVVQKIVTYHETAELEHIFLEDNGHHDLVMKNTWSFENFLTILLQSLFSSSNEVPLQMKVSFLVLCIINEEGIDLDHQNRNERKISSSYR
jgi:hypothetical protein